MYQNYLYFCFLSLTNEVSEEAHASNVIFISLSAVIFVCLKVKGASTYSHILFVKDFLFIFDQIRLLSLLEINFGFQIWSKNRERAVREILVFRKYQLFRGFLIPPLEVIFFREKRNLRTTKLAPRFICIKKQEKQENKYILHTALIYTHVIKRI